MNYIMLHQGNESFYKLFRKAQKEFFKHIKNCKRAIIHSEANIRSSRQYLLSSFNIICQIHYKTFSMMCSLCLCVYVCGGMSDKVLENIRESEEISVDGICVTLRHCRLQSI